MKLSDAFKILVNRGMNDCLQNDLYSNQKTQAKEVGRIFDGSAWRLAVKTISDAWENGKIQIEDEE